MRMNFVYLVNTNLKLFATIEKYKIMVKLSQQLHVRGYSFAESTTRNRNSAFKIVSRSCRIEVFLQGT